MKFNTSIKSALSLLIVAALAFPLSGFAAKGGGGGGGGGTPPPPPGPTVVVTPETQLIANPLSVVINGGHALNANTAAFHLVQRGDFIQTPRPPAGFFESKQYVAVYNRIGTLWNRQQLLSASDVRDNVGVGSTGFFGWSIALASDTLIASITNNPCSTGGVVHGPYVYHRTQGVWTEEARLVPNDIPANVCRDYYYEVALSGDTAVVRLASTLPASALYVFQRSALGQWTQTNKLAVVGGSPMSLSGNTLVFASSTGVKVFERSAGVWNFKTTLKPRDLNVVDGQVHGVFFGLSVVVNGDTILVGSSDQVLDPSRSIIFGSAYVFQRGTTGVWGQQQKLIPARRENFDGFGNQVSLSGSLALTGQRIGNTGYGSLWTRVGTRWTETVIKGPGVPVERVDKTDTFAAGTLIDGNTALISRLFGEEFVYRISVTP